MNSAPRDKSLVVVVSLIPLPELLIVFFHGLSHDMRQLVCSQDEWNTFPDFLWMPLLLLNYETLALKSQLCILVAISRVEQLVEAALLTDDEMWLALA